MEINFKETESDFYQFIISQGSKNTRTKTNYLSWLRFLSDFYVIDSSLTVEKIDIIIEQEKIRRNTRQKYIREKDISDFRSALRKYLLFIKFDFETIKSDFIEANIIKIEKDTNLTETDKKSIILARIGQGVYRKKIIQYWNSCSIENYKKFDLLIASHIKPWKDSTNAERIDFYNGLLLPPNCDKLFDKGYISFDKNGKIRFSKFINEEDKMFFGLKSEIKLLKIENKHNEYLDYHRDIIFMK